MSVGVADGLQDISNETLWLTAVVVRVGLNIPLSIASLATNVINMVIFWRMGVQSSALEPLLILSLSDGLFGLLGFFAGTCNILRYFGPPHLRRSGCTVNVLLLVSGTVTALTSLVTTVSLTLVRCFSVVRPLQFRSLGSAKPQRIFILTTVLILIAAVAFGFSGTRLEVQEDPNSHRSQLVITFPPEYIERIKFADIYRCFTFIAGFIVINVCFTVMFIALKRALEFRRLAKWSSCGGQASSCMNISQASGTSYDRTGSKISVREVKLLKLMLFVSLVFTLCNLPGIALSLLRLTIPGLSNVGRLRNTFDLILILVEFSLLINTSVNILVYYFCSPIYQNTFLKLFWNSNLKHLKCQPTFLLAKKY